MAEINREAKTLMEWEAILASDEVEALHDNYYTNPEEVISPDAVLEAIVRWHGSISTAYHIRRIISRVYGVDL